jgi:hypothetical protein
MGSVVKLLALGRDDFGLQARECGTCRERRMAGPVFGPVALSFRPGGQKQRWFMIAALGKVAGDFRQQRVMHGSCFSGDGSKALQALADDYHNRLAANPS